MLFNKKVLQWNAILFGVFGLLSLVFGLTGLGAMAIIFGAGNLFAALVCFIVKQNGAAVTCLLVGGCLLLLGFALCSSFPFNIR
jgi:hypothetical protein